jgi:transposase
MLEPLLSGVKIGGKPGAPRRRFETVAGDKGYDGTAMRDAVRAHGSTPAIPHRKRKDGSYRPGATPFDKKTYRRRNVVERTISVKREARPGGER